MFDLVANVLAFLYDINNSYPVAIMLLTLIVLVIATPLTLSGTKSMLKMQLLQPELKAIQDKYGKDEREEMNVEMMEFYKDNQINPVGGCVPLLFQIPVFLVLYRVILGITRRATPTGIEFGEVVGSLNAGVEPVFIETDELLDFNPANVSEDSQIFQDLSNTNVMEGFGFDLARSASQVLGDGIVPALPYLILVAVVGASGFIQHRMIRSRNTGAAANPTQEQIMKIIPFFLPIFSFTLPAAIVLYFLVSNLYRIGQQAYITRSFYSGDDSLGGQIRQNRQGGPQDGDSKGKGGNGGGPKGKGGGGNGGGKNGGGPKGKGGGAKNSSSKHNGSKGSGSKGSGSKGNGKNGNSKGGSGANGGKSGRHRKTPATAGAAKAPGRNASGRDASARSAVEPKARKQKKR